MQTTSTNDIDQLIEKAHKKLATSTVKDLCRYLPGTRGGYLHHFSFARLLNKEPEQLASIIQKSIIEVEHPEQLDSTPRMPRQSKVKRGRKLGRGWTTVELSSSQHITLLQHARATGDQDLEQLLLAPLQDLPLPKLKQQLIKSIRSDQPERSLFESLCTRLAEQEEKSLGQQG